MSRGYQPEEQLDPRASSEAREYSASDGHKTDDVREQEAIWLDTAATPLLHGLASPGLDTLMQGITQLGSTPVVALVAAIALAVLLRSGYGRHALFLATALGGSILLNEILKIVIHRARPKLDWAIAPPEYSFPSGHSMNSLVFYLALALIVLSLRGRRAGTRTPARRMHVAVMVFPSDGPSSVARGT